MESGSLCKKAMEVVKVSFDDVLEVYKTQKSDIEKSLKFSPGVYNGAIAMMYAVLQAPPALFERSMGKIAGTVFNIAYSIIVAPLKLLLQAFDLRTMKNFFSTIWSFVFECIPESLSKIINSMMTTLSEYYNILMKAVRGQKKIDCLKSRQMLTESKHAHLEIRIWDWFKNTIRKVAEKAKSAAWWFLKKGLSVIEKPFMAVVYPFTQCMSRVNKIPGSIGSIFGKNNFTLINKFMGYLGVGGLFASAAISVPASITIAFGGLITFMGNVAMTFTVATALNMVGQFIEFKNLIVDAFDTETPPS